MIKEILLHKDKEEMNTHRTNGTFAFAPTHEANPSAKSKEPFFAQLHREKYVLCILKYLTENEFRKSDIK
ncbi:MAG: hypothetical protein IPI42_08400 [Saprospiraceae bacterium]|nr:hypothetical protein [Candidatus Parvibacillus calidus]